MSSRMNDGKYIYKSTRPLQIWEKELARRTYEQTGNDTIQTHDLTIIIKEAPLMEQTIASIVSPDAPRTTNEKGGSQSQIDVRFDLIDAKAMFEMAKVLDHGAKKYGANNWRNIDVDDHLNHLLMHTFAYLAGDRTDDHLSHILCRATFALGVSLAEPEGPTFADDQIYGVGGAGTAGFRYEADSEPEVQV